MADKKTTTKKAAPKKTEQSLESQLVDAKKDLFDAMKSHRGGELVNPQVIKGYRKQIARVLTAINANKEGK